MDLQPLLLQRLRRGVAHLAAANDDDRVSVGELVVAHERVQGSQLLLGAHHHRHRPLLKHRGCLGRTQPPPLPHADDVDARLPAQPRLGQSAAHVGGVVHRELADDELLERADDVHAAVGDLHPVGQLLTQVLLEQEHPGGAGQAKQVFGFLVFCQGDDGDVGANLPRGEDDRGVGGVVLVDEERPGLVKARGLECGALVQLTAHHGHALHLELGGADRVGHDDMVGDARQVEAPAEPLGDGPPAGEQHMPLLVRGDLPRRLRAHLRLQPRGVEEPDEGEGEDDEQHDDPHQQHQETEHPAEVAHEGDVAEAQCRHHGEGPVKASDPRVLLALVEHDHVEGHREQDDDPGEGGQVASQGSQVAPGLPLLQHVAELASKELHRWPRSVGLPPQPQGGGSCDALPGAPTAWVWASYFVPGSLAGASSRVQCY